LPHRNILSGWPTIHPRPTSLPFRLLLFLWISAGLHAQEAPSAASEVIVQDSQKIDLVTDANLNESINRRPDLNFSNVSLDQENSGVSLSSLPAEAVESAEVMKAATPDLDADTRGSVLRVKYKPSYKLKNRLLSGRVLTRYKDIYDSFGFIGDITSASRWGDHGGYRATAGVEKIMRGSDGMNLDWSDTPSPLSGEHRLDRVILENSRRHYDTLSFNGSADYEFSPGNDFYVRLNQERLRIKATSSSIEFDFGDESGLAALTADSATTTDGTIIRRGSHWRTDFDDLTAAIGGVATFHALDAEWRAQYRSYDEIDPIRENAVFRREGATIGYTRATTEPTLSFPSDDDPSTYSLTNYDHRVRSNLFGSGVAALDLRWDRGFLKTGDFLKFGFKQSTKSLTFDRRTDTFLPTGTTSILLDQFVSSDVRTDFLDQGFSPGFVPDAAATSAFLTSQPGLLERDDLLSALRSDPGSFSVDEDVFAAFTMMNWQGQKLRVAAGARFEQTSLSSTGNEVLVTEDSFEVREQRAANDYGHIFPGIHLQYRASPELSFFSSYTRMVKRPNAADTAPFRVIDIEDREVKEGNPDLRATLFDNWDLALDYTLNEDFVISWEAFYRNVTDTVFVELSTVSTGTFAGFNLEQLRNGGAASLQGTKIVIQQELGSVSDALEAWSWSLAYTYTDSTAEYPQRPNESLPITGTPRDDIEGELSYEGEQLYVQFGLEYGSPELDRVSPLGPAKDVFESDFVSLNLQVEYKLSPRFTAYLDWENLLRGYEEELVEGLNARPFAYRHDPWIVMSGVRFKL
jgi:TonB-dependent receptor